MLINGSKLTEVQHRLVLAAYVHRFAVIGTGRVYASDDEWVRAHSFHFTKDGRLDARYRYCAPALIGQ